MDEINNTPQLFVVAQAGTYLQAKDEKYQKKYQAVCDHLFETIKRDGNLEVKTKTVNTSNEFSAYVDSLRDSHVDKDRPFAFLFIAPEQYGQQANEELENTIREISNATRGDKRDKKVIASSVIFVHNEAKNEAIEFKDHSKTLNALAIVDDNLLKQIKKHWANFTHYSLKTKTDKLKSQIETYIGGLSEYLLTNSGLPKSKVTANSPDIKGTKAEKPKDERNLQCKDLTINDLKLDQQERIKAIDWSKAFEISTDKKGRKKKYPRMQLLKEGLSYGQVADRSGIKATAVKKTVEHFIKHKFDFMKGVDLEAVTKTED